VQQRLESSVAGRAAISVFVSVTVICLALWNLPDDSALQQKSSRVVRPFMLATGLNQNWGVFAPNPRRETLDFVARLTYADGTTETVTVPRGGRLIGSYWDYRWRKWYEYVRSDDHEDLWAPAAAWFAGRARAEGKQPVKVVLVRRWQPTLPPGPGPSHASWHEFAYYTYEVPPASGGAVTG
jgi:hypothetical protein